MLQHGTGSFYQALNIVFNSRLPLVRTLPRGPSGYNIFGLLKPLPALSRPDYA